MSRYAIYFTARGLPLADMGARWLGWDIADAREIGSPIGGAATAVPQKYGFHATLKPPFRLAEGQKEGSLAGAARAIAAEIAPFSTGNLALARLGGFLALIVPASPELDAMAARFVRALDAFRAPPSHAELAKRRRRPLTPRQDQNLMAWGYPYVLEDFRFHMTLTGRLTKEDIARIERSATAHFSAALDAPLQVSSVTLCAERDDGRFIAREEMPLSG